MFFEKKEPSFNYISHICYDSLSRGMLNPVITADRM